MAHKHASATFIILVFLTSIVLPYSTRSAEDNKDEASLELAQLVNEVSDAMVKADIEHLGQLWTDDFTYIHSSGAQQTKPQFLDDVKTGRRKYYSVSLGEMQTRFYGSTAVGTGLTEMKLNAGGHDLDLKIRFTSVFVQQGGKWRMASWQSTAIPAPNAGGR